MIGGRQSTIIRIFSQADFDAFALLSGDNNPIHTDPVFSAGTRFGRTVAHGLLLCSVLRGQIDQLLPGAQLSEVAVMFPAPTYAGESMQFSVTVTGNSDDGPDLKLEVKRLDDDVVTCQGHARGNS